MVKVNDLLPLSSGQASLGVNQSAGDAFDITSIAPFNRFFTLSGVFLDPLLGQSGVMRYSRAAAAFQVSVDGGLTFNDLVTAGNVVTSVGVIGDANLVGAVDFASPASGFIVIQDSSDASPLLWSVNTLGLSGLWGFPTNGFASTYAKCFAATFSAAVTWTVTHNIGTTDVLVIAYDDSSPRKMIIPDDITATSASVVTITFNTAIAGRAVVIGCV